jgi:hypothetical protein
MEVYWHLYGLANRESARIAIENSKAVSEVSSLDILGTSIKPHSFSKNLKMFTSFDCDLYKSRFTKDFEHA